MQRHFITERRTALIGVLTAAVLAVGAIPASANPVRPLPAATAACPTPQFSQLLLAAGDANWYTLAPGEAIDNFTAQGWTLTGGAKIVTTTLADGQTGSVLDLPSSSQAVSPAMCVDSSYPTARSMVRNILGNDSIAIGVSYIGTKMEASPKNRGTVRGGGAAAWTLSDAVKIHPGNVAGWQQVRFTFAAGGQSSELQLYNFYVDPRGA